MSSGSAIRAAAIGALLLLGLAANAQAASHGAHHRAGHDRARHAHHHYRQPDLDLRLTGSPSVVVTGQQVTYSATVANNGVRVAPRLVDRVVTPGGHTVYTGKPQQVERVMSPQSAAQLTDDMRNVVDEGTGTAANVLGLNVAGKTGTAETGVNGLNTAWFIAFAPAEAPRIAVAVLVENGGFGAGNAAPVARKMLDAYLLVKVPGESDGQCARGLGPAGPACRATGAGAGGAPGPSASRTRRW